MKDIVNDNDIYIKMSSVIILNLLLEILIIKQVLARGDYFGGNLVEILKNSKIDKVVLGIVLSKQNAVN